MDNEAYELLIRLDEKVSSIHAELVGNEKNPGLRSRVDSLESAHDSAKGWLAGAGAILAAVWAGIEWLLHKH